MPVLVLVALLFLSVFPARADSSFVVIGTGDLTGVYYPAGGAICRLLNKERDRHGIRCAVESTQGSTYNLNALKRGEMDLAIVQSDWHYHASVGSMIYNEEGANSKLRTLFDLHSEALTIVVRADSGIQTFNELKGKKVNLGNPESGQRRTMDLILSKLGWEYSDFAIASELSASEMSEALCSGRIDAFFYIVGHPNASVSEATTFCESRVIPLPAKLIDDMAEEYSFYSAGEIPGALYRGNPQPIPTITLTASLVTTSDLSDDTAYELAKSVYDNFDAFRQMHPALRFLQRSKSFQISPRITPLHSGVKAFLQDQ